MGEYTIKIKVTLGGTDIDVSQTILLEVLDPCLVAMIVFPELSNSLSLDYYDLTSLEFDPIESHL